MIQVGRDPAWFQVNVTLGTSRLLAVPNASASLPQVVRGILRPMAPDAAAEAEAPAPPEPKLVYRAEAGSGTTVEPQIASFPKPTPGFVYVIRRVPHGGGGDPATEVWLEPLEPQKPAE